MGIRGLVSHKYERVVTTRGWWHAWKVPRAGAMDAAVDPKCAWGAGLPRPRREAPRQPWAGPRGGCHDAARCGCYHHVAGGGVAVTAVS